MGCGALFSAKGAGVEICIARTATENSEPKATELPGKLLADSKMPTVPWIAKAAEAFQGQADVKAMHLNVPCTGPLFEPYTHMDVIVGLSSYHMKEENNPGQGSKYTFASKTVDTIPVYFAFWDTPTSDEAYAKMLVTYCEGAQAMILCFSLSSRKSFESAVSKYYEHVAKVIHAGDYEGSSPLVLAGVGELQAHSREVPFEEAQKQAEKWKAACYIEIDPDDNENVCRVLNDLSRTCIAIAAQQAQKDEPTPAVPSLSGVRAAALVEIRDLREAALKRLLDALGAVEKGDAAAKKAVEDLLAVESFTVGLSQAQLSRLKTHCSQRLQEPRAHLAAAYEREALAKSIGELAGSRHGIRCRQDDVVPAPPVRERRQRVAQAEPSDELVYIAVLVLLAAAIDASFQAAVSAACGGGSHASCPPNAYVKMRNKLANAHVEEEKPRAACNLDVLRCSVTYESAAELQSGFDALVRRFGPPACANNGFRADAAAQNGFRAVVLNWKFASGKKYKELLQQNETLWVQMKDEHAATCNCRKVFDAALIWLRREELAEQEVILICEMELLLTEYLEGRKSFHLHERIVNAESQEILWKNSR